MKQILDILKKSSDYVSGEKLGEQLSVSRAAVWKEIQKLRKEGYEIEAVSNKGYRLLGGDMVYNKRALEEGMETKRMGRSVHFYKEVSTTNDCIRTLALEGCEEGTLAVAEKQTAGRGRRGKAWKSPMGTGIWMSLLLRPHIQPAEAPMLTLLGGLAVADAIEEETGLKAGIKWPNDILINGKKVVGILTEMDCEISQVNFVVLGIGINVNTKTFPAELDGIATSLFLESGKTFSRRYLVQAIMKKLENYYDIFLQAGSFAPLLGEYRKRCITMGKEVCVTGKESFTATAMDVTPEGELVVKRLDNGKEEVVFSGEVSIRGVMENGK